MVLHVIVVVIVVVFVGLFWLLILLFTPFLFFFLPLSMQALAERRPVDGLWTGQRHSLAFLFMSTKLRHRPQTEEEDASALKLGPGI